MSARFFFAAQKKEVGIFGSNILFEVSDDAGRGIVLRFLLIP